ncbi:hypothetical protein RDWZM_008004 [Blomia tropicalis]|uniref:HMA domain-containing protein n=1 Tax=Blomia tropicalis TaxID=40697 RepID=A0A9Q0M0Y4_BLOTA|nr:hypothetical protein RDWZM_008004 [Blomia tropicalis]
MSSFSYNVEFAVQMKCETCKTKIINELSKINGIQITDIDVKEQRLLLRLNDQSPSSFHIQNVIEKLGIHTIIRGTGEFMTSVSEIHGSEKHIQVMGVARFVQNNERQCLLDAVIDGLDSTKHYKLSVHEYGDLSEPNYQSIGDEIFNFVANIIPNGSKLNIKTKVNDCDLTSFIGRAFAIQTDSVIVGAGIMARASKIMDNSKKICACSGKTLWEEREDAKNTNNTS